MKNNIIKVILIILLSETMLVGYSYFTPSIQITVFSDTLKLNFLTFDELTDFTPLKVNLTADSLIDVYLADDDSSLYSKMKRKPIALFRDNSAITKLYNHPIDSIYPLDNFFKALSDSTDSTVIRIAHYGDSKMEGDRITCFVRQKFQENFGGQGIGFVPFFEQSDNVSYSRYSGGNWARYTVFHNRYKNSYYGMSGTVFKFLQCVTDTIFDTTSVDLNNYEIKKTYFDRGTLSIKFLKNTPFSKVRLMYGKCEKKCKINIYNQLNAANLFSDTLPLSKTFNILNFKLPEVSNYMKFEFISSESPEIYGLYFDGNDGVQVDNYAIRGHSGDGLLYINNDYLAKQIKETNTRLIIFQYGSNVVPYIKSDALCQWIEDLYYKMFMHFRKAAPDVSILVVSTGDMARFANGAYSSYKYLPKIRDAQKNAATKAGCAFWDLFEVMGGSNSIIKWVEKKLSSYDGHYSSKGQEIIGNELYKAINDEYTKFNYRKKRKQ